ncbi:MAG: extracellular solute-binding protein, partial [Actinomycetota bacterium]|nr:extracellular solute-binding protein [Actinomycetota bacterium]
QAFVTALRVLVGEEDAKAWLEGIVANEPVVFDGNSPVVEAVAAGEIEVGFVNHYYALKLLAENPELEVANKYYTDGDPGGLVNVTGVGIIQTTDQPGLAQQFVDFMLSATAQEYFASETYEIPLVEGIEQDPAIPNLDTATLPEIDLDQLEDLAGTLELLTAVGAL